MGIFDFFRKGSATPQGGGSASVDKKIANLAKVAGDKRAQTYDRMDAIQALVAIKSPDAAAALLKRFSFSIDPSITDEEEKDYAFRGIVEAGEEVVPAVVEFCLKAEALTWPLKVLRELLDDAEYDKELVALLDRFDTEYVRNVEPKIQVIAALEEVHSKDAREAVERFLEDVNETVRFTAVQTTFAQQDRSSVPKLVELLISEESVRIKNKVAEGLMQRGWVIPADKRDEVRAALMDTGGYDVGSDGKITKVGSGYR